ncbi:MAG TPA: D-arabinono-1,4-lactone oxidase [Rhizomicrobium sp.]|jgi:FAD-linked oxidoreductase|nr:D-arabinono-1,4-lactone oxidase [Rhizomicrobium sp.]
MTLKRGTWFNWSCGVRCDPKVVLAPKNEAKLAAALRTSPAPIRVPGTGHSFTPLCASDGTLIDLSYFAGLRGVDGATQTAAFGAATPLWAVGPALHPHGLALKNMGDIDRQTLAGVVGTGTHGTGATLKGLSAEVAGFQLMLADGQMLNCTAQANADVFAAGRCSLGVLGVMTEITMQARPAHKLVERNFLLTSEDLFRDLDRLSSENRHFEFFWFPYAEHIVCKSLNESDAPSPDPRTTDDMYARGERTSTDERAFALINQALPYAPFLLKPVHRLFSRLMPGSDRARWSYEIFPSPRTVRFNEMEYAVPRARGPECLKEIIATVRDQKINTGFPIEYRTVAADDVWLSPFFERDSATIAVHQYHRVDTTKLFSACEAIFRRYEGRPHWGKRHTRTAYELEMLYPKLNDFRVLRRRLDPDGKFLNLYLREMLE